MRVEFLLLDTTAFNRKADSFADADKRRGDREKAWEQLLEGSGIEPLFLFSRSAVPETETERLLNGP